MEDTMNLEKLRRNYERLNLEDTMNWFSCMKLLGIRNELIYLNDPKRCKLCNKIIDYSKRRNDFCCSSHAATFVNTSRASKQNSLRYCKICGKKLSSYQRKSCSRECHGKLIKRDYKENVLKNGKFPIDRAFGGIATAKRTLIEMRGHACEICGNPHWLGKSIPLVFDHIDGNPMNWRLDNCRLVCGNCNMQLPTFSGKNRGKYKSDRYSWRKNKNGALG